MKTPVLFSALAIAAPLSLMTAAHALVPGSDTFARAQAAAEDHSVVESPGSSRTRAFGYPGSAPARSPDALVPGSDHFRNAAQDRELNRMMNSAPTEQAFPSQRSTIRGLVPGSESFGY